MKRPTKEEVAAEILDLKALKPTGLFKAKTERTISTIIEALEHGFDDTTDEWNELGDELQDAVKQAEGWKEGLVSERPSTGWGGLVS